MSTGSTGDHQLTYASKMSTPEKPVDLCKLSAANASKMSHLSRDKFYYALKTGDLPTVKMLVKFGESVDAKLDMKFKNVLEEEQLTFEQYIERAVERGFYSVTSAREITTPLQLAATNGHSDIVEYLLAQGAEVDFAPKEWTTPLSSACENGHAQCAKLLVEYGADVEYYNKSGLYPIHLCKKGDYLGCARALLEHGANPNARTEDKNSSTALHIAAELGYADLVELLCSRGADPNLKDTEKETPMTVACYFTTGERKFYDTVANLIKGGADLQETDNDHLTPLHTICRRGDHNIVRLLIESGSELNSRDWYGKTPICHALESTMYRREAGRPEVCVQLLLNNGAWPVNPKTLFKVFELCGRAIPSIEVLLNCYGTLEADSKWKKVLPRDVFEENQSFYEAVFRLGKSPPTLQHTCRTVVRTLLGARCERVISELSVAPRLKRYLLLEPGEGGLH